MPTIDEDGIADIQVYEALNNYKRRCNVAALEDEIKYDDLQALVKSRKTIYPLPLDVLLAQLILDVRKQNVKLETIAKNIRYKVD